MKLSEWLRCTCILFIVCVLKKSVFVEGDYIFSIQLISYSNPGNRLASGTCCGGSEEAGTCPTPCNTTLRMCFRNTSQARDDPDCPIQEIIGDADPRGLNPFIQGPWPGVVQLHISVTSANAELIDNFFIELNITANDPLSPTQEYTGENGTAVLQLSFQVLCQFNYFGLDCNTFCLDRNDTTAHFTCGASGEIVCLQGYQNESSNCTQCAPAEGCSTTNGFCIAPGECLCREGWRGEQCNECIPNEGCSPTGGFCFQPGECRCQSGYLGENCTIGPIPTSTPTIPPSSTSAIHDTSIPSGGSSNRTVVLPSTALGILPQPSTTTPEISSSSAVDNTRMNRIASIQPSSSFTSLFQSLSVHSPTSSLTTPSPVTLSTHSSLTTPSPVTLSTHSSLTTPSPVALSTHSSTSSLTTSSPVATPFITPGVDTIRREDSSNLVPLIVGLTVGGGLLILLSALIFLIALLIMVLKRRNRKPKRRRFTDIIYETHTADTTREGTLSPRYVDHSSENRAPAYGLLAHAVAKLDQPHRTSLPDPTYSTFQDDTASGQETCMTSTTELWNEGEDYPVVAGTSSEDTDLNSNHCSAEGIYADEEKFDLSLHQHPDTGEEDSDIDLPVIGNPGATLTDDATSHWDQHPPAADKSAKGDPKAKDRVYAELDHQPTHFELQDDIGQLTGHQRPPLVTYVDVRYNADGQSEEKSERAQMTIRSLV